MNPPALPLPVPVSDPDLLQSGEHPVNVVTIAADHRAHSTVSDAVEAYCNADMSPPGSALLDIVIDGDPAADDAWVPAFPAEGLRKLIEAQNWDMAAALLARYDGSVRAAFDAFPADLQDRRRWDLQIALITRMAQEVAGRRDATEKVLRSLFHSRRGADAYRSQMTSYD